MQKTVRRSEMAFPHLFKEALIGGLYLRNRVVMAPLCSSLSFGDGLVSERMLEYYGARAQGGVGMIISEYICIDSTVGRAKSSQLILDTDDAIGSHNLLTERVHRFNECKIIAQLHHAGRQTNRKLTRGLQAVAPSNVPTEKYPDAVHELTIPEIESLVVKFGEAAYRAKLAGYDGVEIHAAHGYLINQFLSPYFNRRQDAYGRDRQGRMKFFREIIHAVRERAGTEFPILARLSVDEYLPGGLDLEESCRIVREMENLGVSAIDVSRGTFEAPENTCEGMDQPLGCRVRLAERIKKCVSVPVIIAGNIKDPVMADEIIESGKADFIALGRALLADPGWAMKAGKGRSPEIRRCFSCNFCVSQRSAYALSIQCALNPITGNEREFSHYSQLPPGSKAVVIGGGPSGMEAARVLACRGARVQLWEKEERVGGQLNIAVGAVDKTWLGWLIEDQERELRRLGVEILLNKKATTETIFNEDPDIVIIASGAMSKMEEASILEGKGVTIATAWEVLGGQWKPDSDAHQTVAVWGGGRTGCEVAEVLADQCKGLILITSRNRAQLAKDYGNHGLPKLVHCILSHPRITLLEEHRVDDVADGKLIVTSKKSPEDKIPVDASVLIIARGVRSLNDLADYPGKGLIVVVGDAKQPRDIKSAVHEGFVSVFDIDLGRLPSCK